jgi:hypothetical protein
MKKEWGVVPQKEGAKSTAREERRKRKKKKRKRKRKIEREDIGENEDKKKAGCMLCDVFFFLLEWSPHLA